MDKIIVNYIAGLVQPNYPYNQSKKMGLHDGSKWDWVNKGCNADQWQAASGMIA